MITQSFFKEFTVSDNFQLLTPGKTLHFYAGVDANNKPTIFILTSVKPGNLQANGAISVETGRRRDGKWTLSFTLEKSDLLDVFSALPMTWLILLSMLRVKKKDWRLLKVGMRLGGKSWLPGIVVSYLSMLSKASLGRCTFYSIT